MLITQIQQVIEARPGQLAVALAASFGTITTFHPPQFDLQRFIPILAARFEGRIGVCPLDDEWPCGDNRIRRNSCETFLRANSDGSGSARHNILQCVSLDDASVELVSSPLSGGAAHFAPSAILL